MIFLSSIDTPFRFRHAAAAALLPLFAATMPTALPPARRHAAPRFSTPCHFMRQRFAVFRYFDFRHYWPLLILQLLSVFSAAITLSLFSYFHITPLFSLFFAAILFAAISHCRRH
jgi:hypothetical protein